MGDATFIADVDRAVTRGRVSPAQSLILLLLLAGGTALISLVLDFPFFFMVSSFTFIIAIVAAVHDNWFLNSLVIPMFPVLYVALLNDVYMIANGVTWDAAGKIGGEWSLPIHVTSCIIMTWLFASRNSTSFIVMCLATVLYVVWVILVGKHVHVGYVIDFFGGMDAGATIIAFACSGLLVSVITTVKNARVPRREITCDGGWCPL